jgi:hypothetical protein
MLAKNVYYTENSLINLDLAEPVLNNDSTWASHSFSNANENFVYEDVAPAGEGVKTSTLQETLKSTMAFRKAIINK